ncbi:hypothetical protein BGW80DRAFT_1317019 [Lactifluus volemus]|nr:hypothetical protein BGW80DRAFT_1317019 [Lactifluus volemus]
MFRALPVARQAILLSTTCDRDNQFNPNKGKEAPDSQTHLLHYCYHDNFLRRPCVHRVQQRRVPCLFPAACSFCSQHSPIRRGPWLGCHHNCRCHRECLVGLTSGAQPPQALSHAVGTDKSLYIL